MIDAISNYAQGYALFMDFDSDVDCPKIPRLYSIFRVVGITPRAMRYSRTARGWHVAAILTKKAKPMELVALQAICGSDPMRESLNFVRAQQIHKVKGFWRSRWNILYAYKVTE